MKRKQLTKLIARLVYILVGIGAVVGLISFIIAKPTEGMHWYDYISIILLFLGGINWGIKGIIGWDLFEIVEDL